MDTNRIKGFLLDKAGTLFKPITGNIGASDAKHFTNVSVD